MITGCIDTRLITLKIYSLNKDSSLEYFQQGLLNPLVLLQKSFMVKLSMHRNKGDYGFEVKDQLDHSLQTDSGKDSGGLDAGFRPMQLVLAALGSCSAIDVVAILKKQKQDLREFNIDIEAEREEGTIPTLWKSVRMIFLLSGEIEESKAERAVALSVNKYCSVAETLRRGGTEITWVVKLNQ